MLVFYLIFRGGDINLLDVNGCGVMHWSAFQNNLYMLIFFEKIGLNPHELDW